MICLASFSSLTLLHRFKTSKSQFYLTAGVKNVLCGVQILRFREHCVEHANKTSVNVQKRWNLGILRRSCSLMEQVFVSFGEDDGDLLVYVFVNALKILDPQPRIVSHLRLNMLRRVVSTNLLDQFLFINSVKDWSYLSIV
jgi:hypothetical protein